MVFNQSRSSGFGIFSISEFLQLDDFIPSSKKYLSFVLEQLSLLENISYRAMMGEYIIYYRNKIVGGIYDNRFLVKVTKASDEMLPEAVRQLPYEKVKEMLLVDRIDNSEFLVDLLNAIYEELPDRKR